MKLLAAAVLAALILTGCSNEGTETTTSTEPDPTTTTVPETTTTTVPPTTTSPPTTAAPTTTTTTVPHPYDWQAIESEALQGEEKGGGFGMVMSTGSGSWLAAGSVSDADGVPIPTAWVSPDGSDWTAVELPGPDGGAYVNTGAWSGDQGILAGSMAGPERQTPGAVWVVGADGSGELVDSDAFADDLALSRATTLPNGGFLLTGTSGDDVVAYRSADGLEWETDTDLEAALAELVDPSVVTLEAGALGTMAVVIDERGQQDIGVILIDDGDGFAETARLDEGVDIDLEGAVVTGVQYQVYGAVRSGPLYETAAWRSSDGAAWDRVNLSVAISEDHTSWNSYGASFVDAVRASQGLVGIVYEAASYLFVTSDDGVTWTEAPITDQVLDTDVPAIEALAVSGGDVLATSTGGTPAMFRVTDSASQVLDEDLPTRADSSGVEGVAVRDGSILLSASRTSGDQALEATPDRIGSVIEIDLDGTTNEGPDLGDLYVSDVEVTRNGSVVAVGYERFIERFLVDGTIDPKAWRGSGVTDVVEVPTGSAPEANTKRMFQVLALDETLVAVGAHFPQPGTTAPIFWHSSDDGATWTELIVPDQNGTPNIDVYDLCPLPDGGAMVLGQYDAGEQTAPTVWTTSDGSDWTRQVGNPDPLSEENQVQLYACELIGERVLVAGAVGAPLQGAMWETIDGSSFAPVEMPATGDDGFWSDVASTDDGTIYVLGSARTEGLTNYSITTIGPDGTTGEIVSLRTESLLGPTGMANLQRLLVVDNNLVLIGTQSGEIKMWKAPLE